MNIKHNKVIREFYSIVISSTNRDMPSKIDEFLGGYDFSSLDCEWSDQYTVLRDYEGDFEGIRIYYSEDLNGLYDYIASKIDISNVDLQGLNIEITNI